MLAAKVFFTFVVRGLIYIYDIFICAIYLLLFNKEITNKNEEHEFKIFIA